MPAPDASRRFNPRDLDRTVISSPLLEDLAGALKKLKTARAKLDRASAEAMDAPSRSSVSSAKKRLAKAEARLAAEQRVIIDLNLDYAEGRAAARERVLAILEATEGAEPVRPPDGAEEGGLDTGQYVVAEVPLGRVQELVYKDRWGPEAVFPEAEPAEDPSAEPDADLPEAPGQIGRDRAIYRIWPDFELTPLLTKSVATVKADAARSAFSAAGRGIVWAVIDTGIAWHEHFERHGNLDLTGLEPITHYDFTGERKPLTDPDGHGTHVAGIIAGEIPLRHERSVFPTTQRLRADGSVEDADKAKQTKRLPEVLAPRSAVRMRDERTQTTFDLREEDAISGIAPQCKLVSLKVMNARGKMYSSDVIRALAWVHEKNGFGRQINIHGVNLSLGYDFDPRWFACGQSPLCVEVDRLVRSGVVVVVAAGNSGHGVVASGDRAEGFPAGLGLTINDPGNAQQAITVGATHREMPHTYGVSYFSSKGPTGDGRLKPDLLAPGEKVLSCAVGEKASAAIEELTDRDRDVPNAHRLYVEESGTSMATPHVSGAIAAFLSIRREFIGRPEEVKRVFLDTATDLGRDRYFQGAGLLDLMRAIQSV